MREPFIPDHLILDFETFCSTSLQIYRLKLKIRTFLLTEDIVTTTARSGNSQIAAKFLILTLPTEPQLFYLRAPSLPRLIALRI